MSRPLMVFAAGLGRRMGALTATRPKPLIPVAGRALLDHALALGREAGAAPIVVNVHHHAEMMRAHLAGTGALVSDETDALLETGGGLRKALPLLGAGPGSTPGPVWTLNSDSAWTGPNPLRTLDAAWRASMAALLLLVPRDRARGHRGAGDFDLGPDGRLRRGTSHVYAGAQILRPEGLDAIAAAAFSLNRHWDRLPALHGAVHPGGWCDVGHPEGLALAEEMLAEERLAGEVPAGEIGEAARAG